MHELMNSMIFIVSIPLKIKEIYFPVSGLRVKVIVNVKYETQNILKNQPTVGKLLKTGHGFQKNQTYPDLQTVVCSYAIYLPLIANFSHIHQNYTKWFQIQNGAYRC